MTGSLGQSLFDPPNVAGWAGGRTWITPATLLQRGNLFRDVLFPDVEERSVRRIVRCPATDARVGEHLAKGMNITEATKGRRRRVEHDGRPRRGLQHALRRLQGATDAWQRQADRADVLRRSELTSLIAAAGADTAEKVVDQLAPALPERAAREKDRRRCRRSCAASSARRRSAEREAEPALRELLYLVLSTPEYQLG